METFFKQKFCYPGKEKVSFSHRHLIRKALMRSISGISSLPGRGKQPGLVPNLVRGWYGANTNQVQRFPD